MTVTVTNPLHFMYSSYSIIQGVH